MTPSVNARLRRRALAILKRTGFALTPGEKQTMEITDFGLNDPLRIGLALVVYENNDRYCAKELVLLPRQTCPEHRHPPRSQSDPGKTETFRCRWGKLYLYTEGNATPRPRARGLMNYRDALTVWHEIVLRPGEQYTLPPNTLHWFQAGDEGAVLSEFSSPSDDASDIFTDPRIRRVPLPPQVGPDTLSSHVRTPSRLR